jgi:VWFA-related protein
MKKITSLFFFTLLALASASASAQTPVATPPEQTPPKEVQPADEDDVVRITTNLIQLDAVVTDKNGKVVTDLRPEEFEVFVNGKPQQITNFSLVAVEPQPAEQPGSTKKNAVKTSPVPLPPARIRPEQIKRTIAMIFDDLLLADPQSANYMRRAVRKFVDEQMQPGDLVAIIRTGRSFGALQQFTSDKQMLHAAIDRLRYNPMASSVSVSDLLVAGNPLSSNRDIKSSETGDAARLRMLVEASLAAVKYTVQGMRGLPGRKAVLMMTGGFPLDVSDAPEYRALILAAIDRLVDSANRAGVVIYTMDPRGLADVGTAADAVNGSMTSQGIATAMFSAMKAYSAPLEGLTYLANRAGGFAIYNDNDLPGAMRKILADQGSYYLIGYRPDASIFDPANKKFNRLRVKVKRPGLTVRYRSGFFGIKDEDIKPAASTPQQQILQALTSPFASSSLDLRFTPLFGNDAKTGSFVRALVHIPAKDLTFTTKPDGQREAVINVVAYTFGENGSVVDSVGETHTVTLTDSLYQRALTSGLVYSLNVPVKKAGGYQLRVAVRDDKTQKVGTASQFITIPDIKRDRLAVSGISLSSYDPRALKEKGGAQSSEAASGNAMLTQAAQRRFRIGHVLQFAYAIYKARLDNSTQQPQLTTQIKLYKDGKEVFAGKETVYEAKGQADMERLMAEGALQLGGLEEGEYVLQVIVSDLLAKEKERTTTAWTDFEVVK